MFSLETLADLSDYHLYGVCNTCSRMERLKMLVLYDRLGPQHPIACYAPLVNHGADPRVCDRKVACGVWSPGLHVTSDMLDLG